MASLILQIEDEVADLLRADPVFAAIDVFAADRGDITSLIETAIGQAGQAVVVMIERGQVADPDVPGPRFDPLTVKIVVTEMTGMRPAAGYAAAELAEVALGLVHAAEIASSGAAIYADKTALTFHAAEGLIQWTCSLVIAATAPVTVPAAAAVTRGTSGGNATLACATAGAAIFYTVDGRYPSPRVGTLYTAPFPTPSAGTRLRARAWLAGYLASETIDYTY